MTEGQDFEEQNQGAVLAQEQLYYSSLFNKDFLYTLSYRMTILNRPCTKCIDVHVTFDLMGK